jgi:hypothetical protein
MSRTAHSVTHREVERGKRRLSADDPGVFCIAYIMSSFALIRLLDSVVFTFRTHGGRPSCPPHASLPVLSNSTCLLTQMSHAAEVSNLSQNGLLPNGWTALVIAASPTVVIPGVSTNVVGKNYRVSHKIGQGSFGDIYLGESTR